jgi:cation-transporting ATPase 13A3/4/5
VLKNFTFEKHRATQSVIIEGDKDKKRMVFVKGSPEAIRDLCNPESDPEIFGSTLRAGATSGMYQIAIGFEDFEDDANANTKDNDVSKVSRDCAKKELTFAGFINFQNVMKEDSP